MNQEINSFLNLLHHWKNAKNKYAHKISLIYSKSDGISKTTSNQMFFKTFCRSFTPHHIEGSLIRLIVNPLVTDSR